MTWRRARSAAAALALLMAVEAAAAPALPPIDAERLKRDTQALSADALEGRAPATPGEEKTVAYIAAEMEKAGLQPGNKGSWYQEVPLVEVNAKVDRFEVSGGRGTIRLAAPREAVAASARTSPMVGVSGSDLVFVGYGIHAPERGWNDYAGLDVRGKTVVILVNDPDWRTKERKGRFEGRAMTYYGRWTYKYEEAARQGAAAALIVHETEPAGYPWSVVESSWTGPQLYLDDGTGGAKDVSIRGWISQESAARLFTAAGQDLAALTAAAAGPGFKAVPLGLKADIALTNVVRRSKSRNVIGLLPGRTAPGDYFLYTAHWDHLGRCVADQSGDDICNGAVDNASGTAGLLALARAFAAEGAPARSLLFLAVTAEESGLLGSAYYAANPLFPLAKTVGGINMDGLNLVGRTTDVVVIGVGKSELEDELQRVVPLQQRTIEPEPNPEKGFYYRSDHFSLAKVGVPMLYAESGIDVRGRGRAYGQARTDDYIENRYHAPSDEYDPAWDWSGAVEDLQLYYLLGRRLADSNRWPAWYKDAEFRPVRERSLAGGQP